jgi:mRNA interferase YafQ
MRTIRRSTRFKKDVRRELKSGSSAVVRETLADLLQLLAEDMPLPDRFRDHALTGNWIGYRDCHVRPDLVLIYQKPDDLELSLVRLGSHSELDL